VCLDHFKKYDSENLLKFEKLKWKKVRCCECRRHATNVHRWVYASYDGWCEGYTCDRHFENQFDEDAEKEFDRFVNWGIIQGRFVEK